MTDVKMFDTLGAQRALVGIILREGTVVDTVKAKVGDNGFTDYNLKIIFNICSDFSASGRSYTWEIVADALSQIDNKSLELQNPMAYVAELVSAAPDLSQLDFFLNILSERENRLKAVAAADEFKKLIVMPTTSAEDIYFSVKKIEDCFHSVDVGRVLVAEPENFWDLISSDVQTIMHSTMIGTGFERLDKYLTFGFVPGISTIAGRPTMGKSSFRANIQRLLSAAGYSTITIAREQSLLDEYFRQISIHTGMSVATLVRGLRATARGDIYESFNIEIFEQAIDYLQNPKCPYVYIEPRGMFFLKDIRRYVDDYRRKGFDPKIVFIDLFNQLDDFRNVFEPGKKAGMIAQKMIEAGNLARELQIHICCVVQLRRLGKDRGKIDRQELYKESGAYEERCDLMFQVERPAYYKPDILDNTMQIYIGKQRMGERARTVDLLWERECMRISDIAPPDAEEDDTLLSEGF